ncbi:MAG: MBL fold metallo-hydrolase [Candidatus Kapaibacterium sp.]|nr:MAG: MBL fold metallo-hydrolase [Candidatus Kapabacteria bacterium]
MKFTILGSGTSTGVPLAGCGCETCRSTDTRDKRLRPSLLVESATTTIVIDTSADFRYQMLRLGVQKIDGVVFTHHHFDHIGGFDDLRAFNFLLRKALPIYLMEETMENLRRTFLYAFVDTGQKGGGVPVVEQNIITTAPFTVGDIEFLPIPMMHGKMRVNGYRIGNFAYCTDTNFIFEESFELLRGLDVLILDALRYDAHPTHFTVNEAIACAERIGAKQTYFTHIAHNILHADLSQRLPQGIALAYDGLVMEC